ncbi:MAG TPA: OmpA family protein [Flavobacteriales bacterium]|nr:OmpA family protein [Flavobacteriales bacterium]
MHKLRFFSMLCLLIAGNAAKAQMGSQSIYYSSNHWQYSPADTLIIYNLVQDFLKSESIEPLQHHLRIIGHTDSDASNAYNQELSKKRAKEIEKYVSRYIKNPMLYSVAWSGEEYPKDINTTEEGKAKNRRVEISYDKHFYPSCGTKPFEYQYNACQRFCINPLKDTFIVGRQGTAIIIKANSVILPKEYKGQCVTYELREALTMTDMFMMQLNTTSDDKILETGGMIYLRAKIDSNNLVINGSNKITVMIPADTFDSRMGLFDGVTHNDTILDNWIRSNNPLLGGNLKAFMIDCYIESISTKKPFENCPLFFCKIKRALTPKSKRKKTTTPTTVNPRGADCATLDSMRRIYGDNYDRIARILKNKQVEDARKRMNQGNASYDDVNYYIFNMSDFGWRNIDCFSAANGFAKVNITVTDSTHNTLSRMVFKGMKVILSPTGSYADATRFQGIPVNMDAWIISTKRKEGKILFSAIPLTVKNDTDFKPEYKEIQPAQLEISLKKIFGD